MAANFMTRSPSSPALHSSAYSMEPQCSWFAPSPLSLPQPSQRMMLSSGSFNATGVSPGVSSNGLGHALSLEASPRVRQVRASGGGSMSPFPERRPTSSLRNNCSLGRVHSSDDVWQLSRSKKSGRVSSEEGMTGPTEDTGIEKPSSSPGGGKDDQALGYVPLVPVNLLGARVQHFVSSAQGLVPAPVTTSLENTLPRPNMLPRQPSIAEEEQGLQESEEDTEQSTSFQLNAQHDTLNKHRRGLEGNRSSLHEHLMVENQKLPYGDNEIMHELMLFAKESSSMSDLDSADIVGFSCNMEPCASIPSGHPEVTENYYSRALADDPENTLILRNYARFLAQTKGDYVAAEQFLERAIVVCPGDADVLVQYAKLLWDFRRDADRAIMYFERAVQAAPDDCYVLAAYASFMWSVESFSVANGKPPPEPMSPTGLLSPTPA